jgi:hypothetical protein
LQESGFLKWLLMPLTILKNNQSMRNFHPVSSLVVTRNLQLILLSKIWLFSKLVKHTSKISKLLRIQKLCFFFP